jgi:predicted transcriptional regulator
MSEEQAIARSELLSLTKDIVMAHLSSSPCGNADVPALVQTVFNTLTALARDGEPARVALTPAVPIRRSVTDDHIVCLEDGRKLKMLKRHLMTAYGMTPEQYRAKWGLPRDYPMVAPSYARKRQELAKAIGLGRKPAPTTLERGGKPRRSSRNRRRPEPGRDRGLR